MPLYYPRVLGALGSAHALEGRLDEAVELLEQAVAESRAIRLLYGYASLVTSLGEACLWAGQLDEASRLAAEARGRWRASAASAATRAGRST